MDLFFLVHGVPKLLPPGWCPVAYSIFGIWPDIKGIPCLTFPQLICQKWHCPHYISRSESQSSLTTCLKSPDWQLPNPGYELSLSEFREQSLCLLCGHGAQSCRCTGLLVCVTSYFIFPVHLNYCCLFWLPMSSIYAVSNPLLAYLLIFLILLLCILHVV